MNKTYRSLIISLSLAVFLALLGFILITISENLNIETDGPIPEKLIEIDDPHVTGYKDGKKTYEIFATYAWSTKQKHIIILEDIYQGDVYLRGYKIVTSLEAKMAKLNRDSQEIELFGSKTPTLETTTLSCKINTAPVPTKEGEKKDYKPNFAKLKTWRLLYTPQIRKFVLEKKITVKATDFSLAATAMEFNQDNQLAVLPEKCTFYKNGSVLKGNEARIMFSSKKMILSNGIEFINYQKGDRVYLSADSLDYNLADGSVRFVKDIRIKSRNSSATANEATWSEKDKSLTLQSDVVLDNYDNKTHMQAKSSSMILKNKILTLTGAVKAVINRSKKFKEKTIITCQLLSLFEKNKNFEAAGNVEIFQPKKVIIGNKATYMNKDKLLVVTGQAKAIIEKMSNILNPKSTKTLKDPEFRKVLEDKTVLSANQINVDTQSQDLVGKRNVEVAQKGRLAKSDLAKYTSKDEKIVLTNNVTMQKDNGDWIKCKKAIVYVKDQIFEALGGVEIEFRIKR